MKFNPYRPNSMVGPGMFAGRYDEMKSIESSLFQTKNGNPKHFLVEGERGIGKSSLMFYVELIAKDKTLDGEPLNFIVISLELNEKTTYQDLVERIFLSFKESVAEHHKIKELAKQAWDFLTNWSVFGVEYRKAAAPDAVVLVDELCNGFANFLKTAGEEVDGIVILLDEADKPASSAHLGLFAKQFTERMTRLQCERVCLGLAGLPTLTTRLRESHESSPRIFDSLYLEPLEPKEIERAIKRGLEIAKEKNGNETAIQKEALDVLVSLSEGYPHFIQQFSYSAFEKDDDWSISTDDVLNGAYKENGALDQLGSRYFTQMYYEKIYSEDYRTVLNAMSKVLDGWLTRAEIIKSSGIKESQVNNALKALKDRGIILQDEGRTGRYRLPTKSFGVWIRALNARPKKLTA